jgi:hypothetical protein
MKRKTGLYIGSRNEFNEDALICSLYPFQLFKNKLFIAVKNAGSWDTSPMLSRHLSK